MDLKARVRRATRAPLRDQGCPRSNSRMRSFPLGFLAENEDKGPRPLTLQYSTTRFMILSMMAICFSYDTCDATKKVPRDNLTPEEMARSSPPSASRMKPTVFGDCSSLYRKPLSCPTQHRCDIKQRTRELTNNPTSPHNRAALRTCWLTLSELNLVRDWSRESYAANRAPESQIAHRCGETASQRGGRTSACRWAALRGTRWFRLTSCGDKGDRRGKGDQNLGQGKLRRKSERSGTFALTSHASLAVLRSFTCSKPRQTADDIGRTVIPVIRPGPSPELLSCDRDKPGD